MTSRNPFNTGSPARGGGFIGRQNIISNCITFLNDQSQYNYTIHGQRRIGKTSFLRKLQTIPSIIELAIPVYYNLQDQSEKPLNLALLDISKRLIMDLELNIPINDSDFSESKATNYFKNSLLPLIIKALPEQKNLLILFDEFDVLGIKDDIEGDSVISNITSRSLIPFVVNLIEDIQEHYYPVKFIFAIGRNYKDLDPKRFGQLFKFGPCDEITCFSLEETQTLLNLSLTSIPFEKKAIDETFSLTSGHPYFTQCLASVTFEMASKKSIDIITAEMIRDNFPDAIKRFSSGVFWIWDSLSPIQQIVLFIIAILVEENKRAIPESIQEKAQTLDVVPSLENLTQTLSKLQQSKFLECNDSGEYSFYVEFIRKWIVAEVSGKEITKLLDVLDPEINIHLSNARFHFETKKDYKLTIEHGLKVLQKWSLHFESLYYVARSYMYLRSENNQYLDKAIEYFKKAFAINPSQTKKEYLVLLKEKLGSLENKNVNEKITYELINKQIEILNEIQRIDPYNPDSKGKLLFLYQMNNKDIPPIVLRKVVSDNLIVDKIKRDLTKSEVKIKNPEIKVKFDNIMRTLFKNVGSIKRL